MYRINEGGRVISRYLKIMLAREKGKKEQRKKSGRRRGPAAAVYEHDNITLFSKAKRPHVALSELEAMNTLFIYPPLFFKLSEFSIFFSLFSQSC